MRVVLLQCELQHRHQAPHLAGALFLRDLREAGHDARGVLVHPSALDRLEADADLLVLDSVFPFGLQRRLRERLDTPILVGGHNAVQHALRGPADFALEGPARASLPLAVAAIAAGRPDDAPGLWFRRDGLLRCGPPPPDARPADELLPFEPDHDWEYLGPPRAEGSNLRVPSVVAELGCVWNRPVDRAPSWAGVEPRLPEVPMAPEAAEALQRRFVQRAGGCTFCTLRYQPRRGHRLERTLELLEHQVRAWIQRGARGVSLQTEHPLPLLVPLFDTLAAAGLHLDELHVRTIPWLVLRHEDALRAAIARARAAGTRLVLGQVGFEAFDAPTLALYNKGLTVEENRAAARLLGALTATEGDAFEGTSGHGLVPLHPFSTPRDLLVTLDALRADAPWLLGSVGPFSRVELYNEWSPLWWRLADEGLLQPAPDAFGWTWRYADPRMEELTAASASILAAGGWGADVLEDVARALLDEPDPRRRRERYLALREAVRA